MTTTVSIDTKERILNVAERLFAENGFAGTSLRSVIREANVNISAVHYHFGSKEKLFHATIARIAKVVVAGQLKLLAKCETEYDSPPIEAILETFFVPPLEVVINGGDRSINCARFMGRCRVEPDSIRNIAEEEFKGSRKAYLDAFSRALPDFSRTELRWKLDLVIAVLLRVLTEYRKPGSLIQDNSPKTIKTAISKLVAFLAPALRS